MANEVLTIHVKIEGSWSVTGGTGQVNMVAFSGDVDCENFKGVILPHGVDTQTLTGGHMALSARYMLEGTDAGGAPCRVFIENNGASDDPREPMRTTPRIVTDSSRLKWLEDAALYGTIEPAARDEIFIHIFAEG